jgi:hypothetical protein
MFLKEIQQTKYKKIKLKQLLILLCRILMIIFLVIAFSKPFQHGYLPQSGEKVRSTVLLILDNSFSMETRSDSGSVFDEAKKKMIETVDLLNEKSVLDGEFYFTTTSKLGIAGEKILYDNKEELLDSVKSCKISATTNDIDYILYYVNKILSSSSNTFKELFYFTDGQKSTFSNEKTSSVEIINDENTKYNIILCGKRAGNNISIDTVNIISKIFQPGKVIKLKCTVNNHNNFDALNNTLTLNIEGDTKARDEKAIDIPANSSVDVEFSFVPKGHGFGGGFIELIPSSTSLQVAPLGQNCDEIISDNKRYFAYKIPEKIKLLAVCRSAQDIDFIKLALSSSEELSQVAPVGKDSTGYGFTSSREKTNYFDVHQAGENELLKEMNKDKFDCILISNKGSFNEQEASKLYDYVQNGGGLLIYPGDNSDINNYNSVLFKKFDLSGINGSFGNRNGNEKYKFEKVDFEHPVFEGIFKNSDNTQSGFFKESPFIKFGYNLVGGINSIPLVKLNNERYFLVEYTSGRGKILFYSVAPGMDYSDFPSKNIFSPITVRSILYLSNINTPKEAVTGKDYYIEPDNIEIKQRDTLFLSNSNDYNKLKFLDVVNNSGLLNLKTYINNTANYKITSPQNILLEFSVNFDKRESIPDKMNEKELNDIFKNKYKLTPNIISPEKDFVSSISQIRTGRELWKIFLILSIIFLLSELIISKLFIKKEAGKVPQSH